MKTWRKRMSRRTNSFRSGFTQDTEEERRGFQKRKWKERKWQNSTRLSLRLQGFSFFLEWPLLFSSTTPQGHKQMSFLSHKTLTQSKQWSDERPALAPALARGLLYCFSPVNIHSSVHPFIHPPGNCVNYIPLQCHRALPRHVTPQKNSNKNSGQDDTHTHREIKIKKGKQRTSHPSRPAVCVFFFKSAPVFSHLHHSRLAFSSFPGSLMTKTKSKWSWTFFGWLSPSRVLSGGSGDMSPSPSARISASARGQSRSASHSAGCPWCDLGCTNPDLPAEGRNGKQGMSWRLQDTTWRETAAALTPPRSPLYTTGWRCILQRSSWLSRPSWTATWSSCTPRTPARIPDSPRWTRCAGKLGTPPDHLRQSRGEEESKQEELTWSAMATSQLKLCSEFKRPK